MKNNGSKQPPASGEVAIVGAGFSGLLLSVALARSGFPVRVFEEHGRAGIPPHCTGIVSSDTIRLIEAITGRAMPGSLIRQDLSGIIACSEEGGKCVKIRVRSGLAMLDRPVLDRYLAEEAASLGSQINYNTVITSVSPKGAVRVKRGGVLKFNSVVLAEGAKPRLRVSLGLGMLEQPGYGVNYIVDCDYNIWKNINTENKYATVIFSRRFSPGYAWMIPLREGDCIVGVASQRLSKVLGFLRGLRIRSGYGGRLYVGHTPNTRVREERLIVFGDAAGLNKPLSGGGLYPQARAVYDLINELMHNDSLGDIISLLEEKIVKTVKSLRKASALSRLILEKPSLTACILEVLNDEVEISDYDNHHKTALELLRQASLRPKPKYCKATTLLKMLASLLPSILLP